MAIYEIITLEQSGFGGEFSRRYLFDKDRIIAISKPGKEAYPHWPAEHYTSDTERKVA